MRRRRPRAEWALALCLGVALLCPRLSLGAEEADPAGSAAAVLTRSAVGAYGSGATLLTAATLDSRLGGVTRGGPGWVVSSILGSLELMGGTALLVTASALRDGRVYSPVRATSSPWHLRRLERDHYNVVAYVVLPFQLIATFGGVVLASWSPSEPWLWGVVGPHQAAALGAFLGGVIAASTLEAQWRAARRGAEVLPSEDERRARRRPRVRVYPAGLGVVGVF